MFQYKNLNFIGQQVSCKQGGWGRKVPNLPSVCLRQCLWLPRTIIILSPGHLVPLVVGPTTQNLGPRSCHRRTRRFNTYGTREHLFQAVPVVTTDHHHLVTGSFGPTSRGSHYPESGFQILWPADQKVWHVWDQRPSWQALLVVTLDHHHFVTGSFGPTSRGSHYPESGSQILSPSDE